MSYIKFAFVLVCAILVSQASADPIKDTAISKIVKKIVVDVTGVLDKILVDADKVVASLSKDGLAPFQKQTVDIAYRAVDWVRKISADELQKIDSKINADAKVVSKCLIANGPSVVNLIISYYNLTTLCWNPALKPLIASAEPLITDLKKIDDDVAKFAPDLDKCGNDLCVMQIVQKIVAEIKTIPDVLKKDLPAIDVAGKAFATSAVQCLNENAETWRPRSYTLFNTIASCIRAK